MAREPVLVPPISAWPVALLRSGGRLETARTPGGCAGWHARVPCGVSNPLTPVSYKRVHISSLAAVMPVHMPRCALVHALECPRPPLGCVSQNRAHQGAAHTGTRRSCVPGIEKLPWPLPTSHRLMD